MSQSQTKCGSQKEGKKRRGPDTGIKVAWQAKAADDYCNILLLELEKKVIQLLIFRHWAQGNILWCFLSDYSVKEERGIPWLAVMNSMSRTGLPSNSYVETLNSNVMILGGKAFGR